ncbi:MAG: hypothetical protein OES69_00285 [Myxococcales bacterium]|nr:hypothetical protein [Myxococcales bacterium]MDH3842346.1 hypothetical protein [Myxococcales bacterium]
MELAVEVAGIFAVFVLLLCTWGVLVPSRIVAFATRWTNRQGLWVAALLRVTFGIALWFAAPASRAPLFLQVLGILTILAGVSLPMIGLDRFTKLIEWSVERPPIVVRLWCLLGIALGGAILWALIPAAS